jgi:hypothetical protein
MPSVKQETIDLVKHMPEDITWDELMYEINLKRKVFLALKSLEEGKIVSHEEVKKRFIK